MATTTSSEATGSFFSELRERRVPQIFGIYLGAGWATIQFVDWLVNRYYFSPHLTDLVLTLLISLIPAILMLAFFHGKPGQDSWTTFEKVGIPLNILFAIGLVWFLFGDKALGSSVKKITAKNEEGQEVVRTVPKQDFLKKMAAFYFETAETDPELQWQAKAVPLLLSSDLSQDSFFKIISPYSINPMTIKMMMVDEIKKAGYGDGENIPLALQAKLAQDNHFPFFLTGRLSKEGGQIQANYKIHNSKTRKTKASGVVTDKDYASMLDKLALAIKKDMDVPAVHIEETIDLPINELLTSSPAALKKYVEGYDALQVGQLPAASAAFEKAVEIDPNMAHSYIMLQVVYLATNQAEKRTPLYKPLMNNLYKLPERDQYFVKADYYMSKQDGEKSFAVIEMVTQLFPEDTTGWGMLGFYQKMRNETESAIETYKHLMKLDPSSVDILLVIGGLYLDQGNYQEAKDYYERYTEKVPDATKGYEALGELHIKQGAYDEANAYFEKALLLDPENIQMLIKTAEVAVKAGKFTRTQEILEQSLTIAETPNDRYRVFDNLEKYHRLRGEMKLAMEALRLKEAEEVKFQQPFRVILGKLATLDLYVEAGEEQKARDLLEETRAKLGPPFDRYLCLGEAALYGATGEKELLQEAMNATDQLIKDFKNEFLRPAYFRGMGMVHELEGDFGKALEQYQAQKKAAPNNPVVNRDIARSYRELGELGKAEAAIKNCLNVLPFSPKAHYEMALLKHKKGDTAKAKTHLDKALEIWKDADPEYKPAAEARAKKEAWRELG